MLPCQLGRHRAVSAPFVNMELLVPELSADSAQSYVNIL